MIVLGFDPGTASTGWGVMEQDGNRLRSLGHGCIVTSAKDPTHVRLRQIHDRRAASSSASARTSWCSKSCS